MRDRYPSTSSDRIVPDHRTVLARPGRRPLRYAMACIAFLLLPIAQSWAQDDLLRIGDPAPDIPASLWSSDPGPNISELRGKVVMLYFLAPGCPACDSFQTPLDGWKRDFGSQLVVIGIADGGRSKLNSYARSKNFRCISDPGRQVMGRYIGTINRYPYVAIIDVNGQISWYGRGKFHGQVEEEIKRALRGTAEPKVASKITGKRRAVVVGVGKKPVGQLILAAPREDAQAFSDLLAARHGFAEVTILIDDPVLPPERQPTGANIKSALEAMAGASGPGDGMIFFFSGEGVQQNVGLGKRDIMLQAADYPSPRGLLTLYKVREILNQSQCPNKLVIIDTCHEDTSRPKLYENIARELGKHLDGMPLLLSAARGDKSNHVSRPGSPGGRQTLFSWLLINGLEGNADQNGDGVIVNDELFRHIREGMSNWSRRTRTGVLQTPFLINGEEGPQVDFTVPSPSR